MSEAVACRDGKQALARALFHPPRAPRAGVLVFPTIVNTAPGIVAKARALAIRATPEGYRARLRTGLGTLTGLETAQGLPVAPIGFCMGGQAALELAREGA